MRTYSELHAYVRGAAQRKIGLLLIRSRGGLGKSHTIRSALDSLGTQYLILSCHVTPLATYAELEKHKNETVFINDLDAFFKNATNTSLLKQLCETKPIKRISYTSRSPMAADMPPFFDTASNVVFDCNKLPSKDASVNALLTRGVNVWFDPSNEEVMRNLKTWAKDKEIVSYLETLSKMPGVEIDLRKYVVAEEVKRAKLDWRRFLNEELEVQGDLLVAHEITQNKKSYKQRAKEWVKRTGKTERSYDRAIKKLREGGARERSGSDTED